MRGWSSFGFAMVLGCSAPPEDRAQIPGVTATAVVVPSASVEAVAPVVSGSASVFGSAAVGPLRPNRAELLDSGRGAPGPVVLQGGDVYFMGGRCAFRLKAGETKTTTVACLTPNEFPAGGGRDPVLAVDGSSVYMTGAQTENCVVYSASKGGGQLKQLVKVAQCPSSLATDGTHVYGVGIGDLWRVPVAGGAREVVAKLGGAGRDLSLDGGTAYFFQVASGDEGAVRVRPGSTAPDLFWKRFMEVGARDATGFFAYQVGDGLWSLPVAGGPEKQLAKASGSTRALALNSTHVFWVAEFDCTRERVLQPEGAFLFRVSKSTGRKSMLTPTLCTTGIAADEDGVYVTTGEALDCSALEAAARKDKNALVLGTCEIGKWGFRRYSLKGG